MNTYSRLSDLKAELQGAASGTSNDAVMLRMLERASRGIDTLCQRHFYSVLATRLYALAPGRVGRDPSQLELPDDLISVTTLRADTDVDATYETTLVVNTDYWLYPYNLPANEPYTRIDLNPLSAELTTWPTTRRLIQVVGKFGYSDETQVATTLGAAIVSTTATTFTSAASPDLSPGDTVVIGSEQMDVTVVSGTTITVVRGINGTTAATHLIGATVYRRRFPRDVELATVMQAARFTREVQTGFSGSIGNSDLAGFSFSSMYPAIRDLLNPYRRHPIAVA